MRLTQSIAPALLLLVAGVAQAASGWGFEDASVQIATKKAAESIREKFTQTSPLAKPVSLGTTNTLKLSLTAKDNGKGKRPHQAFLVLQEQESGLEAPFPLTVKESGKAVAQITQKDLPVQFLLASKPLKASVVLASFGSAPGLNSPVFEVQIEADASAPRPAYEKPLRYGKQPEIHHIFRPDPKSPPKIISLVFGLAVIATLPALLVGWAVLGGNLNHLTTAMGAAPLSHASFFGSIVAMEFVFFMYYTSWNLFQTLPVIGAVAAVAVLSGTKALGEVQSRRLAGQR
ncbi:Oligosaccharyltransferase subunit Ribophorin II-domain-containing protein [Staphylotrichum tortipilum]|uniref:Oligosaccharyltransferase subunit Ribophorin II-domain-containing protein n=1 Tax=Staphylotrichum tortipilum TaxID=2831512 RepID=A0AAN6RTP3_9PEZI|nr:Oligosaccharyltransferase subunit Ribophorin II-domain-containing protein [Staphylotrichum longicolle]